MNIPSDQDVVILLIEDNMHGQIFIDYIRRRYSPNSQWARSQQSVIRLFDSNWKPHLVLHDCMPLRNDDDQLDCIEAGDELYVRFLKHDLPVVIVTGLAVDEVQQRPCYSLEPPLAWLQKPVTYELLDSAVDHFRNWLARAQA